MFKFLRTVILYLLFIGLLGYGLIYLSIKISPGKMLGNATEYELWKYKKQLINTTYNSPKNIIIGDSRVMTGLNPIVIKHDIINAAISGTTTFEGLSTLKMFLSHSKIDTLIIGYGIFHYIESDVLEKWTLPYQLNPSVSELNDLERIERKLNITLDNHEPDYLLYMKRKATYYHVPTEFRSTFIENLKQNDYKSFVINHLKENLGFSNESKADSASETDTELEIALKAHRFIPNPVILSYLDSLYNLSARHKIKLILVIPPINTSSYKELIKTPFWAGYLTFISKMKSEYPNMIIDNKNTFLPNTYFADPNHLNNKGASFFSNYIKSTYFENYY